MQLCYHVIQKDCVRKFQTMLIQKGKNAQRNTITLNTSVNIQCSFYIGNVQLQKQHNEAPLRKWHVLKMPFLTIVKIQVCEIW